MIQYVRNDILPMYLADTLKARVMQSDGKYLRPKLSGNGTEPINVQEWFLKSRQGIQR
jgi:polyphosphate kinase